MAGSEPLKSESGRRSTIKFEGIRVLLGLSLVGVVTRFLFLSRQSASVDEVSEVAIASSPDLADLILAGDGFPPLFNLLLRVAVALSDSTNEVMTGRIASALFGVALLYPAYLFARRLVGSRAAGLALVLVVTSPILIWHSQESRTYSLFVLLACCALACFYRAIETDGRWAWCGFLISCVLGSLTHYYFPLVPALLLLLHAVVPLSGDPERSVAVEHGSNRSFSRRFRVTYAAIAGALLPALALLRADLSHQTQYTDSFAVRFDPMSVGYTYFSFLHGAAIGPSIRRLHSMSAAQAVGEFLPWLTLSGLFLGLAALGLWQIRARLLASATRNAVIHLLVLSVLPVTAAGAAALLLGVHYKPSYSLWSVVPLLTLLALGVDSLSLLRNGRSLQALALCVFLVLAILGVTHRNFVAEHVNEELAELSRYMETHAHPDDVNLVMSAYVGAHLRRSFRENWRIFLIDNAGCDEQGLRSALAKAEAALAESTTPQSRLIYSRPFHGDPCSNFIDELSRRYDLGLEAIFAGIEVFRIEPRDSLSEPIPDR